MRSGNGLKKACSVGVEGLTDVPDEVVGILKAD